VSGARAAFIDRDGVIDELVPDPASGLPESPLRPEDVVLIPRAAEALRALRAAGWLLVQVSNQPAAAKGAVTVAQLQDVQAQVQELLAAEGAGFDDVRMCLHHPDGVVPELTGACRCRKPEPGMLLDAAEKLGIDLAASWMIGDTDSDVLAGRSAGCHTLLVVNRHSDHKRHGQSSADGCVPSLYQAIPLLSGADHDD
jgi:D-glycero-D-manno-heptose 1,7-bisphosphate phosphatase